MPAAPLSAADATQRLRIRFRKAGDLRWISHRDLARAMERLTRRAGLALRMSEGFHPKPKLSFPSALAVGIEGHVEVLELELLRPEDPAEVAGRLADLAPAGLTIVHVEAVDRAAGKARVRSVTYQFPLPAHRRCAAEQAWQRICQGASVPVRREGRADPLELTAERISLQWMEDAVQFRLWTIAQAAVRPREVLQVLGLADLEQEGAVLSRSEVELTS